MCAVYLMTSVTALLKRTLEYTISSDAALPENNLNHVTMCSSSDTHHRTISISEKLETT